MSDENFLLSVKYKVFKNGSFQTSDLFSFDNEGAALDAYSVWVQDNQTVSARLVNTNSGFLVRNFNRERNQV